MLLQFAVGNFLSFKEKATLSLEATADDWREDDNVAQLSNPDRRVVRAAAIYGSNAGGKSNLIGSMWLFRHMVLGSSKDTQRGEPVPMFPFRLHSDTENAPTFFEVVFLENQTRYRYGFEATKEAIVSEWLFRQANSVRETCLFTRERNSIAARDAFKEGKGLEERTRPNALFLSVAAQFNGSVAGEVVGWIDRLRMITEVRGADYLRFTTELLGDKDYGESIRDLVRQADVGIEDLVREDFPKDTLARHLGDEFTIKAVHQRFGPGNQAIGTVSFALETQESAGTGQLFALAGPFLHTLGEGAVLVVDELDAHLHPLLTRQLVALFNSSANRKNAQLIFATHDQGLLDQKRIRRDQVWFVEKDAMGASSLFCLDEIKGVRKDANFEKEYLLGLFGGVPRVGDFEKALVHAEE
jgi:AAA15 family ATPase/GTPase